eukprot:2868884-Amphidinium_carterae.1
MMLLTDETPLGRMMLFMIPVLTDEPPHERMILFLPPAHTDALPQGRFLLLHEPLLLPALACAPIIERTKLSWMTGRAREGG